jgi:hypothetical protein
MSLPCSGPYFECVLTLDKRSSPRGRNRRSLQMYRSKTWKAIGNFTRLSDIIEVRIGIALRMFQLPKRSSEEELNSTSTT